MPQLQLPIFHEGVHLITPHLGYQREGDDIAYLHGMMPVFLHRVDDLASFKMIVSQFYLNGHARAYHGHQTKLPRHYIARERPCLRVTTDYWVNGLDGLPFFKHNQAAITHLCAELNASQTHYPGTDLLMIFKSVSN